MAFPIAFTSQLEFPEGNCVCCVRTFASALEEWFDLRPELSVLVYFWCEMNCQVESWITCISYHERS